MISVWSTLCTPYHEVPMIPHSELQYWLFHVLINLDSGFHPEWSQHQSNVFTIDSLSLVKRVLSST